MDMGVIKFPSGLHLVVSEISSFRYEDCEDGKSFDFVYNKKGFNIEFRENIPMESKFAFEQKINYMFNISGIRNK